VGNGQQAGFINNPFPAKPADIPADPTPLDAPTYTVAWFHTHTPMTYRTGGTRQVGPSGSLATLTDDYGFGARLGLPGIVYDYVESSPGLGTIAAGHALHAPAKRYPIDPERRETP